MLELQQLQYAVEVERTGSISKAAEKFYVSQPFLSKAIRALETSVGFEIFNRTSRGVVATKKGEAFLSHAKEILASAEDLENKFLPRRTTAYNLEFAVPVACYVSHAFVEFIKNIDKSAGIHVDYRETNTMNAIERIASHDCNLGVIRYSLDYEDYYLRYLESKDIKCRPLWDFEYRLVFYKNSPLARKTNITLEDLNGMIEITHGDPTVPSLSAAENLKLHSKNKETKEIVVYERQSQFELLCQVPNTYMWASRTPKSVMDVYPLVERTCSGATVCRDALIWRSSYHITDGDRLFIESINDTIEMLKEGESQK